MNCSGIQYQHINQTLSLLAITIKLRTGGVKNSLLVNRHLFSVCIPLHVEAETKLAVRATDSKVVTDISSKHEKKKSHVNY